MPSHFRPTTMKHTIHPLLVGAVTAPALLLASAALAASDAPPAPDTIGDAFAHGKVSLNVRARYESVDQTALQDADAYTIRTRLGFTTAPVDGFKAMVEGETITAIDGDRYSQAGLNPGGAGRAVVADPTGSEINQAFLSYTSGQTNVIAGRQRLVLDHARFVGDVGWRQNMQTFDAVTVTDKSVGKLSFTYSYLYQIDRVFGDRSVQGRWRSDSHLVNASYTGLPFGTLTGYAYLLDFKNSAANSCATYGASLTGTVPAGNAKLAYRAEYATQTDYRNNPASYSAEYWTGELGVVTKPGTLAAGYELLGTDHNIGFKTPLATLHAFNGWADNFLATPAAGLRDTYGKAATTLPGALGLLAFYHDFETDTGLDLGHEVDVQLTRKFGKYFTGLVKYAKFNRDTTTVPALKKFWVQVEFAY